MKKILLFSLLFGSYIANGQSYHKLINESFYWDVPYAEEGYICNGYGPNGPYRYKFSGDTIINDKIYSKIYQSLFINLNTPPAPNCPPFAVDTVFSMVSQVFLREDTLAKKVWRYTTYNTPEEILLYDFSVEQGDTLDWGNLGQSIVDTVYDIITFDGLTRKKIEFSSAGFFPSGYYIEGLGGEGGLLGEPILGYGPWLQCVLDLDQNLIWSDNGICYDFITNVSSIIDRSTISVYPNPFSEYLTLETSLNSFKVKIYNMYGNEVFVEEINKSKKIDLSSFSPGIYILKVFKKDDEIMTKRIIKTKGL